jgi:hypothetical protein
MIQPTVDARRNHHQIMTATQDLLHNFRDRIAKSYFDYDPYSFIVDRKSTLSA